MFSFSTLSKKWRTFHGLLRFIRVVGWWNFLLTLLTALWRRPKPRHFRYEGLPVLNILGIEDARYAQMLATDVADFRTRDDDVFVVAYSKSGHHWS